MIKMENDQITSPDIEAFQAMKILEAGDREGAIKKCLEAIEAFGPNGNCYLVKARAHLELEEFGFAEEAVKSVLKLDPEHPAAWAMLGETYYRSGDERKVEYCRARIENIFPALTEYFDKGDEEPEVELPGHETRKVKHKETSIVPLEDLNLESAKPEPGPEGLTITEEINDFDTEEPPKEKSEPAEPPAVLKSELFETATFADICFKQGKYDKSLNIYRRLLTKEPANARYKEKIRIIEAKMGIS